LDDKEELKMNIEKENSPRRPVLFTELPSTISIHVRVIEPYDLKNQLAKVINYGQHMLLHHFNFIEQG
jgi:hypothetical protein